MPKLVNRAKMTTATTGTGTITLGSAVAGYQTFASAGVADTNVVRYTIEDGSAWEIGAGTYTATGTTLSRTPSESSSAGAAISLSGNAVVFVTAAAADLQELVTFAETFALPTVDGTNGQVLSTNGAGTLTFTTVGGASLSGQTDSASPFETSLGFEAGLNTTGVNNTFVGYRAGKANGTGAGNTAVGYLAATALTTGSNNVAIGNGALDAATTGGNNVAIGQDAMGAGIVTASLGNNTSIGYRAGFSITSGTDNTSIGDRAGTSISDGGSNVSIGPTAGQYVNGSRFIALGVGALAGNSTSFATGADNIGIGAQTGQFLTTGSTNSFIGYQTGRNVTTGSNNVALGNGALDAATTGGRNIAIGQDAMGLGVATTAAGDNVAIGYQAGYNFTTATNRVAIGRGALLSSTINAISNSGDVAIGFNALNAASTSSFYNTAVGYEASLSLTADDVTAIGWRAGRANTTGVGNTFLGAASGMSVTTGQQNVLLGYLAGQATPALTTGSNNIVVGYNAAASSATISNEITLGNASVANFRVPGVGFSFSTTQGAVVPKTITAAGTTGAQTINKTAGSVNFVAAATSLVVTNSFVTANSVIIATVGTNDTTMKSVAAVANSGSFTLYANAAPTAETRVNFMVVN